MKNILKTIKPQNKNGTINVIIEIEKGSKNKYELDKNTGLIKLDRVMYTAQSYPFDYGFIPNTLWHDGDPLDVVLLTSYSIHPGVLVEARPIAYINMIDNNESDVKVIAVPENDPRFKNLKDIEDINPHTLDEINHFFETYKMLENKKVEIPSTHDKKETLEVIKKSIQLFKKKK
ncbi:MAG: inorganic diphosphatase [Candidatus Paceibacterota bacterium]